MTIVGQGDPLWGESLHNAGFTLHVNDKTDPFESVRGTDRSSLFLDTNSKSFTTFDAPQNLYYGSTVTQEENDSFELYNCSITNPKIEGNVSCNGQSCAVTQMRRLENASSSPLDPPFSWIEYSDLLRFIPGSLGYPRFLTSSPVDLYMHGSDAPFSVWEGSFNSSTNIPGAVFAKRLTTFINTVWQGSLSPYSIGLGSSANFTAEQYEDPYVPSATTTATTYEVVEEAQYTANRNHAIILLFITMILQACAVAGIVLRQMTKAPDILGYVSSMTRDNIHTSVPSGGNTLDGIERARYLADMRLQLADVRPGGDVGHIALRSVQLPTESGIGRLKKKRLYF